MTIEDPSKRMGERVAERERPRRLVERSAPEQHVAVTQVETPDWSAVEIRGDQRDRSRFRQFARGRSKPRNRLQDPIAPGVDAVEDAGLPLRGGLEAIGARAFAHARPPIGARSMVRSPSST